MKKLLALVLALGLVFSLAACGGSSDKAPTSDIKDPVELLNNVWAKFAEDEAFMVYGGDGGEDGMSVVDGGAGSFALTNAEYLQSQWAFPAAEISKIDAAATMMHGMMLNNFCAGAYKVIDAANTEALVASIKDGIVNMRWMCGQPEKYIIATVDDLYIVSVYGSAMNIDNFKAHLAEAYPQAKVVVEEAIA